MLALSEAWWRTHTVHNEFSRKFVHITVGSFVAFWPFFLSWRDIRLLSLAFLIVVGLSKYLNIFRAIHSVNRPTLGEVFFAVAVGAVSFMTRSKWVYAAAILQMSLADGLAAVIGSRYGKRNSYHVLWAPKSVIGTATFLVVALLILAGYGHWAPAILSWPRLVITAGVATVIENIGVYGLDNLLVPLAVALALR